MELSEESYEHRRECQQYGLDPKATTRWELDLERMRNRPCPSCGDPARHDIPAMCEQCHNLVLAQRELDRGKARDAAVWARKARDARDRDRAGEYWPDGHGCVERPSAGERAFEERYS